VLQFSLKTWNKQKTDPVILMGSSIVRALKRAASSSLNITTLFISIKSREQYATMAGPPHTDRFPTKYMYNNRQLKYEKSIIPRTQNSKLYGIKNA
jgi:hypothetical protein